MEYIAAACFGKSSGAENLLETYRNPADTTDKLQVTLDGNYNRTAITKDP